MGPRKHSSRVHVCATPDEVYRESARHVLAILRAGGHEPVHWVLSGGSTPEGVYREIAGQGESFRESEIHVYWGDERAVAPTAPQSNYGMASRSLLQHVPIPPEQIHRVRGEVEPADAAAEYERTVCESIGRSGSADPRADLILLGIGADGHTASLFPGAPSLKERNRLFVASSAPDGSPRITATLRMINGARHIVFLALGAAKASAVARALRGTPGYDCPASLIAPRSGSIAWFLDSEAAADLGPEPR